MRVLMTCQPAPSHAVQLVPLAHDLARNGHAVVIAAPESLASRLRAQGLDSRPIGRDWAVRSGDPVFDATVSRKDIFGFADAADTSLINDLSTLVAEFAPDVVVREYTEFAGWAVALASGIPVITQGIMHRVPPPVEAGLAEAAGRIAALAGVEPAGGMDELLGASYIDPVPASFRAPWEGDNERHQPVRPSTFDWATNNAPAWLDELGRDRPLVYATFGTVFLTHGLWDKVVAGLGQLDVDVVVTTGGANPANMPSPPNVHAHRYVPQSHILQRAAAVVCHAGFNTLMGAFARGVPALCLPIDADQPVNAACCERAGTGINAANAPARDPRGPLVDPATLDPDAVVRALNRLLTEPTFSTAAGLMAKEIISMPAPSELTGPLEGVAFAGR